MTMMFSIRDYILISHELFLFSVLKRVQPTVIKKNTSQKHAGHYRAVHPALPQQLDRRPDVKV